MPRRLSSPTLVGRRAELAALRAALDRAVSGSPGLVLVGGDAGVGKTRLVGELAIQARESGARVLVGACLDVGDEGLPYGPFLEVLRSLAREVPPSLLATMLGPGRDALVRLVPGLTRLLDPDGTVSPVADPGADGAAEQARLFELSLSILAGIGADRPLVLVIEDLQWADEASRDLLVFLTRNAGRERVLTIGTYRADAVGPADPLRTWLAELARDARVERLELPPLDADEQREQLGEILGHRPPDELAERIFRQAAGNPFFAEELLAAAGDEAAGGGSAGGTSGHLSTTIRDLLAARIAGVSEPARLVLSACALAGRAIDEALIGQVTDLDDDALDRAIRESLDRWILEPGPAQDGWRVRHPLLAEAIVADLMPRDRRRLHGRFGEVLERHPALGEAGTAGAAAELARHWAAAGRDGDALRASIAAGQAALTSFAGHDALRQFERALDLWDRLDDRVEWTSVDRATLHQRASEAAELAGDPAGAVAHVSAAIADLEPGTDPRREGWLRSRLGFGLWAAGDSQAAVRAHREAVAIIPTDPPSVERARALGALAGALMGLGRFRESLDLAIEALGAARSISAHQEEGRALNVLGCDLVGLGEVDDGLARMVAARDVAERHGPPDALLGVYHNMAYLLVQADRLEEGVRVAAEGLGVAAGIGLGRRFGAGLRATAGDALFRLGRWPEVEEITGPGLDLDSDPLGRVYLRTIRSRLMTARGELEASAAELDGAGGLAVEDLDPDLGAHVCIARAELALAADRPTEALAAANTGFERLDGSDELGLLGPLVGIGMAAAADLAADARARRSGAGLAAARAAAADLRERARLLAADVAARPAAATATMLAELATAEAESGRVEAHSDAAAWVAAAAAWDRAGSPYRAAGSRYRAAEALLMARGPRGTAGELLIEAHEAARRLGAVPLERATTELARQARIDVPAVAAPVGPSLGRSAAEDAAEYGDTTAEFGLSVREREVLALVAAGRSNREIGEVLFISPKTASVHVTHILDKLGVNSRVEAALVAARAGFWSEAPGPEAAEHLASGR